MTMKWPSWLLAIAYVVIGFGVYASVLGSFFLADDFAYLDAIKTTDSPSVMFSALAGRYFRPMAMFVYYANYQISGLSPWSYHVSMLGVHLVNTWLVFLLGRQLAPDRGLLLPSLSGLLFLVFGGHAEAISWISGMADPLVTLFLLTGLLCFLRSLDSPRPVLWAAGVWLAFVGALLSKESSAIFPGLALLALVFRVGWPNRTYLRRAALALAPLVVIAVAYLAIRKQILGFSLVTLEGLGTSPSLLRSARMFFARSFLPQGPLLVWIWQHYVDLLGWLLVGAGFVWGALRREYRALTFLTLCLFLALAPVLPLSIGIATTDSERLIYLPSAFASLLIVWTLDAILRRPWLVTLATLLLCTWNIVELRRHNRVWKEAAVMAQGMAESFGPVVREHWRPGQPIFLMGLPDNLRSKFMWRRGFHEGLRVISPDLGDAIERTYVMSIVNVNADDGQVDVVQRAPDSYELQLTNSTLATGGGPESNAYYTLREIRPTGFIADFTRMAGRGLVIAFTPRRTALAGRIPVSPLPFGHIDRPAGAIACHEQDPTILGWALDDEGIARVAIAIERSDVPGGLIEIGEAQRQPRPDVAQTFPGLPDSSRAGWVFASPCAAAKTKGMKATVQVVAIAENTRGGKTRLGTRALTMAK